MAAITSIGLLWDRLSALVTAKGFTRARNPFDFEQQPDQALDQAFCLKSARSSTLGYLGGDQAEVHTIEIFLCRRVKRDAWGAARQLKVDMDLIEAAAAADYPTHDYVIVDDGVQADVQDPQSGQDFVIGRLTLRCEFDRIM